MDAFLHHIFIQPSNFDRSLSFYNGTLGWKILRSWGGNTVNSQRGVALGMGSVQFILAEPHHSSSENSIDSNVLGRPTIHISLADLEEYYKQFSTDHGLVCPISTTHWGTRWFVFHDPDGNYLAFEG
jgi:catechol 2,3-dioxygenase-like lactoylglutathione lyase family enzyme